MNRRSFLKGLGLTTAAALIVPNIVLSETRCDADYIATSIMNGKVLRNKDFIIRKPIILEGDCNNGKMINCKVKVSKENNEKVMIIKDKTCNYFIMGNVFL